MKLYWFKIIEAIRNEFEQYINSQPFFLKESGTKVHGEGKNQP